MNNNVSQSFNILELTFNADRIPNTIVGEVSTRNGHVFHGNGTFNIAKCNLGRLHFENIGIYLYFAVECSNNINTGYFLQSFNPVLSYFSIMLEFYQIKIS